MAEYVFDVDLCYSRRSFLCMSRTLPLAHCYCIGQRSRRSQKMCFVCLCSVNCVSVFSFFSYLDREHQVMSSGEKCWETPRRFKSASKKLHVSDEALYLLAHLFGVVYGSTLLRKKCKKITYNRRYSPMVTHLTTNLPVEGLTCGEQTGSGVILRLWSYVTAGIILVVYILNGCEQACEP